MNTSPGVKGFVSVPLIDRFLARVNKTDTCWLWTGANDGKYGQIWMNGRIHKAHRVSHELFIGPIPDGLFVCHKCDVMLCVNPDHLFAGTNAENMRDCVEKGRHHTALRPERIARGSRQGSSKLTEADVFEIRRLGLSGVTTKEICAIYGMSQTVIDYIKRGATWKHVPMPMADELLQEKQG